MGDCTSGHCQISTDATDLCMVRTLCKRKDQKKGPHPIPRWLAKYTVDIDEEQDLLHHLIDAVPSPPRASLVIVQLLYSVLVYSKACGPNDEDEGDELPRGLQLILIALAKLIVSVAKFHGL